MKTLQRSTLSLVTAFTAVFLLPAITLQAQPPNWEERPVTEQETATFNALFEDCLDQPVEIQDIQWMPPVSTFTALSAWQDAGRGRRTRFMGVFVEDTQTLEWEPGFFGQMGEQVLGNSAEPTFLGGRVEAAEAEEVHRLITDFWMEQTEAGPIHIAGISSSRQTELTCQYESLPSLPQTGDIQYAVSVSSKAPPAQPPPPTGRAQLSSAPSADEYTFWLRREDDSAEPVITEVNCAPSRCNSEVLEDLQAGITDPVDPSVVEARSQAIRDAVPEGYTLLDEPPISRFMAWDREVMISSFVRVRTSPDSTGLVTVTCSRLMDGESVWACQHTLHGVR